MAAAFATNTGFDGRTIFHALSRVSNDELWCGDGQLVRMAMLGVWTLTPSEFTVI